MAANQIRGTVRGTIRPPSRPQERGFIETLNTSKTGVKTDHVIDPRTGEPVVGLRQFKDPVKAYTRYFTLLARGKRKQFGTSKDILSAIARYRVWEAKQGNQTASIETPLGDSQMGKILQNNVAAKHPGVKVVLTSNAVREDRVETASFWDIVREAYLRDPVRFTQRINMEQIESARLSGLLNWFVEDRQNKVSRDQIVSTKTRWNEFIELTGKTFACELTMPVFKRYEEAVTDIQESNNRANKWTRNRIASIQTVIRHAIAKRPLSGDDIKALSHQTVMDMPAKDDTNPVKITRKQWSALMVAAKGDKWSTALLLVALNGAYLPVDCRRLTWAHIDFENRCIKFPRQKSRAIKGKSTPRICWLRNSTIEALKILQAENRSRNITHTHVFISSQGQPCAKQTITRLFQKLADKAGVGGVTARNIRHTAITAASNDPTVPDRHVDLLAGHSTGIKEHYVVPNAVRMACEAIEREYFSKWRGNN